MHKIFNVTPKSILTNDLFCCIFISYDLNGNNVNSIRINARRIPVTGFYKSCFIMLMYTATANYNREIPTVNNMPGLFMPVDAANVSVANAPGYPDR